MVDTALRIGGMKALSNDLDRQAARCKEYLIMLYFHTVNDNLLAMVSLSTRLAMLSSLLIASLMIGISLTSTGRLSSPTSGLYKVSKKLSIH